MSSLKICGNWIFGFHILHVVWCLKMTVFVQAENVIFVVGRKVNMLSQVKGGEKREQLRGKVISRIIKMPDGESKICSCAYVRIQPLLCAARSRRYKIFNLKMRWNLFFFRSAEAAGKICRAKVHQRHIIACQIPPRSVTWRIGMRSVKYKIRPKVDHIQGGSKKRTPDLFLL